MRGAWGKPYGVVARVNIGQPIMSIRCKDSNKHVIMEALRRARYKVRFFSSASLGFFEELSQQTPSRVLALQFPGRQKIIVSKKWGFTSVNREEYEVLKAEKKVINDGFVCSLFPLAGWWCAELTTTLLSPALYTELTSSSSDLTVLFSRTSRPSSELKSGRRWPLLWLRGRLS
jgi:hypothetical protein